MKCACGICEKQFEAGELVRHPAGGADICKSCAKMMESTDEPFGVPKAERKATLEDVRVETEMVKNQLVRISETLSRTAETSAHTAYWVRFMGVCLLISIILALISWLLSSLGGAGR